MGHAVFSESQGRAVKHVRFSQVERNQRALDASLRHIEREICPVVESLPGSLGLAVHASAGLGVVILESFWATDEAMRASERAIAPGHGEAALLGGGTVTVERYRLPVFEQDVPARGGERARLTRMDAEPAGVDDVIEVFGDTFVPWLAETAGFHSALLCADPASGRLVIQDIWHDPPTLAASAAAAAAARAAVARSTPCVIRAVQEYVQVFSSVRMPRS
jgi:quinol monooxygenase YgiN